MESKDEKLKTCFGGDVTYTKYYEMFENANVVNFKRNKDLGGALVIISWSPISLINS